MKKWKYYLGCLVVFLLLFTAFYFTIWQFIAVFILDLHGRYVVREMRKPVVYKPVAERLALYCQSDPNLFSNPIDFAWLPAELNSIDHDADFKHIFDVSNNYIQVVMGGGFHHFGYILDLDKTKSTVTANTWILSLYDGGDSWSDSDKEFLYTFEMPSNKTITAEELLPLVMAEYDKEFDRVEEFEIKELAESKEAARKFLESKMSETAGDSSLRSE